MDSWPIVRLADVAEIRFSSVDKKSNGGESPVRLCNYMDVYANDYITADMPFMEASATRNEIERFRVEKGDIMLTKDSETPDDIGIPAVVVDEIDGLVCGYHLALIKPDGQKVAPLYLAKQLASRPTATYFSRLANGSTRYGLSSSAIASAAILIAPISQQRRIGEILSAVDATIEQTEALIAKYQQIKAGLMHDLFTRGVTPDGRLRPTRAQAPDLYKESPLGWIPKGWDIFRFNDVITSCVLGVTARGMSEISESIPLIKMGNLNWGKLDLSEVELLTRTLVQDERQFLRSGDFLFNTRNTPELVGKTAVYRGEFESSTCDNNILCVRFKSGVGSRFVCQYMSHGIGKQRVFSMATGTTSVAAIYWSALSRFQIPVPKSPEESKLIADRVDALSEFLTSEQTSAEKLRQQKHSLMHDLLTGRVRVKTAEPVSP